MLVTLIILQICATVFPPGFMIPLSPQSMSKTVLTGEANVPKGHSSAVSEQTSFLWASAKLFKAWQALKLRSLSGPADCLSLSSSHRHVVFEEVALRS